ncbi:hypothetical protein [Paenibacillus pinihumi]|uniref:hypothetical protein n=1 Tax=Paenibacillus pinihumi TaxID=669462 RepID=UPI00040BC134|nr:hypothetical protein [Paenibacillus pinihumi]
MYSKLIEQLLMNNWQTLSTLFYGGWVLRFADGYTFTKPHQHTVFKITPHTSPANLDQILEQKGYSVKNKSNVQTLKLDSIKQPELHSFQIAEKPDAEWIENFCRLNEDSTGHKNTILQLLSNIKTKAGFISLYHDNQAVPE